MAAVLSCILPVHGPAPQLGQTLDSILNQSFGWFELLLLDDGSTNENTSLCRQYAQKDVRIRLFRLSQASEAEMKNTAIDEAEGRYLAFVEPGEMLGSKAFAKMVQAMENRGLDWISANYTLQGSQQSQPMEHPAFAAQEKEQLWQQFPSYYKTGQLEVLCNKLYRTQLIREFGLRFLPLEAWMQTLTFQLDYLRAVRSMEHMAESLAQCPVPPWQEDTQPLASLTITQQKLEALHPFLNEEQQASLYAPLVADSLPPLVTTQFDLMCSKETNYSFEERSQALETIFAQPLWHAVLLSQLKQRTGFYNQCVCKAVEAKNPSLILLPLRLKRPKG